MTTIGTAYEGRADHPWPPFVDGWAEVPHDDAIARVRARSLLWQLPPYHYADEPLETGLYRFFAFETPIGEAVGALKYIGEQRALALMGALPTRAIQIPAHNPGTIVVTGVQQGQAFAVDLPDGATWQTGLSANDTSSAIGSAPSQGSNPAGFTFAGQGGGTLTAMWTDADGNLQTTILSLTSSVQEAPPATVQDAPQTTVTPVSYGSKSAAAVAMNNALIAHGYKRADQGIYKGFQALAGTTVDGFPGTHTMTDLRATLAAMSPPVAPANVKTYPWLSSGRYDGVNAPTWAEWTGATTPPATPATSGKSNAGAIAALTALGVTIAGVIAKASGAIG